MAQAIATCKPMKPQRRGMARKAAAPFFCIGAPLLGHGRQENFRDEEVAAREARILVSHNPTTATKGDGGLLFSAAVKAA